MCFRSSALDTGGQVKAGRLRHKVTFHQYFETQDTTGHAIKTYTPLATRSVSIEPLSGRELEVARQVNAEITHKVEMRYLANLSPRLRFLFGSRVFEILSILNIEEKKKQLTLLCVERAA